jgi:GDSL-like lipase/acylhydrolase family protein
MRKSLVNAALLLLSVAVAFAIGELAVRLLLKDSTALFPRYHTDYRYGSYVLRGIRPNSEFWHTSVDGHWKFTTNSKGLRDLREFSYDKPTGTLRVLALGDSHTQGYEVRQEATYAAVLERYLDRYGMQAEVLNTGVSGFSNAEELAYLENEGYRYEPDVVVLGFFANDFLDNDKAALFDLREGKLVEIKREHIPGVRIQNFIYSIPGCRWLSEHSYLYSVLFNTVWAYFKQRLARQASDRGAAGSRSNATENTFEYAVARPSKLTDRQIELAARLIERMQSFCTQHGILLLVADIPAPRSNLGYRSSLPAALTARLDAAGVERLDSTAMLKDFDGVVELHVPHGARHISEFTHAMIGVELGRRIRQKLQAASGDASSATP